MPDDVGNSAVAAKSSLGLGKSSSTTTTSSTSSSSSRPKGMDLAGRSEQERSRFREAALKLTGKQAGDSDDDDFDSDDDDDDFDDNGDGNDDGDEDFVDEDEDPQPQTKEASRKTTTTRTTKGWREVTPEVPVARVQELFPKFEPGKILAFTELFAPPEPPIPAMPKTVRFGSEFGFGREVRAVPGKDESQIFTRYKVRSQTDNTKSSNDALGASNADELGYNTVPTLDVKVTNPQPDPSFATHASTLPVPTLPIPTSTPMGIELEEWESKIIFDDADSSSNPSSTAMELEAPASHHTRLDNLHTYYNREVDAVPWEEAIILDDAPSTSQLSATRLLIDLNDPYMVLGEEAEEAEEEFEDDDSDEEGEGEEGGDNNNNNGEDGELGEDELDEWEELEEGEEDFDGEEGVEEVGGDGAEGGKRKRRRKKRGKEYAAPNFRAARRKTVAVVHGDAESVERMRVMTRPLRGFNVSYDPFYATIVKPDSAKRKSNLRAVIKHAKPAMELHPALYPTQLTPENMRNFHKPRLLFFNPARRSFTLHLPRVRDREIDVEDVDYDPAEPFSTRKDLSHTISEATMVAFEHIDEMPLLLSGIGMASELISYYRKRSKDDTRPAELQSEFGVPMVLGPREPFPMYGGELKRGSELLMMTNNLFKAAVAPQTLVMSNDFLVVRPRGKKHRAQMFIHNMPKMYAIAQLQPQIILPGPNSKPYLSLVRKRLSLFVLRLFQEDHDRIFKLSDVGKYFPQHAESTLRKRLRDVAILQRGKDGDNYWRIRQDIRARFPTEAALLEMLTPEEICIYLAIERGQQVLRDVKDVFAHTSRDYFAGNETKMAPWTLTKNFDSSRQHRTYLDLDADVGDPLGFGAGIPFIKWSKKVPSRGLVLETANIPDLHNTDARVTKQQISTLLVYRRYMKRLESRFAQQVKLISAPAPPSYEGARTTTVVTSSEYGSGGNAQLLTAEIKGEDSWAGLYRDEVLDIIAPRDVIRERKKRKTLAGRASGTGGSGSAASEARRAREAAEDDEAAMHAMLAEDNDSSMTARERARARKAAKREAARNKERRYYVKVTLPSGKSYMVKDGATVQHYISRKKGKRGSVIGVERFALSKDDEEQAARLAVIAERNRETLRKKVSMGLDNTNTVLGQRSAATMVCGACGLIGHMRTNALCPVYAVSRKKRLARQARKGGGSANSVMLLKINTKIDENDTFVKPRRKRGRPRKNPKNLINKRRFDLDADDRRRKRGGARARAYAKNDKAADLKSLNRIFRSIVEAMKTRDSGYGWFHELVTDAIAPGYSAVVSTPVSLNAMRDNANACEYYTVKAFLDDVDLLKNNAVAYNGPDSPISNLAVELHSLARAKIEKKQIQLTALELKAVPFVKELEFKKRMAKHGYSEKDLAKLREREKWAAAQGVAIDGITYNPDEEYSYYSEEYYSEE